MDFVGTLLLAAALAAPAALPAQTTGHQPVQTNEPAGSLPNEPMALLRLASEVNGLRGNEEKAWHVRLQWHVAEYNTRPASQGFFEEWWVSPHRDKIVWSGPGFQQTLYRTDKGLFVVGSASPAPADILDLVDDAIRVPLPAETGSALQPTQIVRNGVTMHCVSRGPDLALSPESGRLASAYQACFAGSPPAMRLEQGIGVEALFASPERFQDRWLARSVRFIEEPGPEVDLSFDQIAVLSPDARVDFTPPPGAAQLPGRMQVATNVLREYRIPGGLPPSYPRAARRLRIQGTVQIALVVRKDGLVASVRAVSGPVALRHAAEVAAAEWRFHPFFDHGKPVEVEGDMPVTFSLPAGAGVHTPRPAARHAAP